MRTATRLLPLLLAILALPARGQEGDDLAWLKAAVPACSDGAVTTACRCGGAKVTSGYCVGGVAWDTDPSTLLAGPLPVQF